MNQSPYLTVLIADDHPVFRLGFRQILEDFHFIRNILEAGNGQEAINKLEKNNIDILFLDLKMPKVDGFDVLRHLNKNPITKPKTIVVSMRIEKYPLLEAYNLGIDGFITKFSDVREIARLIERISEKDTYFSPEVYKILFHSLLKQKDQKSVYATTDLTLIEQKVVRCICKQYTNDEIADELCISANTVKRHRLRIKDKIDAKNVVGFIQYALSNGIVSSDDMKSWE